MNDADNEDLDDIARILAGEKEVFARLVERHGAAVAGQMRNFSPNPAVVDELAHDVFVEAYLHLAEYRREAPFRHWLARIATITGYRYWKTRERGGRNLPFDEERDDAVRRNGERGDPDAAAALLHAMLSELPEADRLLLGMMYMERCGQKEMALRLGCSKTAVAVRIFRAKKKLRRLGEDKRWKEKIRWMIS
jgi:RNA polymerase sigma-70 factor (ECF subfamily)